MVSSIASQCQHAPQDPGGSISSIRLGGASCALPAKVTGVVTIPTTSVEQSPWIRLGYLIHHCPIPICLPVPPASPVALLISFHWDGIPFYEGELPSLFRLG